MDGNSSSAIPLDVFDAACPSRRRLTDATGRWGALTLAALVDGPLRFGALRRRIDGISDKMLAQTLQALEADKLVDRTVLGVMPPSVEYALTLSGTAVAAKVVELIEVLYASMATESAPLR
ncbi:MAG TPA: winged helix-turn-helix transcriptional regulator [Trueperaceae bacterium]|nr:winged helix-turn-helix transcriptional regulator [Trueperaceae bacterium]